MILNSIRFNNFSFAGSVYTKKPTTPPIKDSFKRKADFKSFKLSSELSTQAKKELISQVYDVISNDCPPMGKGATGAVYHLKNVDGLKPYGAVAKISYLEDKNKVTGERQKVGITYDNEIAMLKKVKSLGDNSQQYLGRVKLGDGREVLLTTFVLGKNPDFKTNPISNKAVTSLLNILVELDSIGILHRDLKKENIIIDSDSNARLIDFGEAIEFDILNGKKCDNEMNFPPFVVPSNIQNFEDTFLSEYIADMQKVDKQKAKEFYKDYLAQKANLYHAKTAQNLSNHLNENIDNLSDAEKRRISELCNYQTIMADVLSKKSDDDTIVNIEMMKNQITYMSELAYKNEVLLANPLANISMKTNAVICAKKMETMILDALNRPNSLEVNEYLKYQYKIAKYRQNKISDWLTGVVGWLCTCVKTDASNMDENKKKLIEDCLKDNLEDFEIPNIASNATKQV